MKRLHIVLFFILFTSAGFCQESTNQVRLKEIPKEINLALEDEDYKKAASLKSEKKNREDLEVALKNEDYAKAAELNELIKNGSTSVSENDNASKINSLENEMQTAVNNEDYKKAGELKKQIEFLKSGGSVEDMPNSSAQNTQSKANVPEIEFVNQVYLYNNDGSISKLEKVKGKLTTSAGGFGGYGSATSSYMLLGSSSPIRLNSSTLKFVVKIYQGIDPSEYFKLAKVEVRGRKKNRYLDQYKSSSAWGHSESGEVNDQQIEINFKKLSDDVYEVVIPNGLEPGEYAFSYIQSIFAFGVD